MSRYKASIIHLAMSVVLMLFLCALLSLTWYPPEYVWAVGGFGLIGIVAVVDACLGPLLTLIIWDTKKASLKFDMAVIILVQILGLSYGLYAIFMARPVYMIFSVDRFDLVTAADIPEAELEKAQREEFKSLPLTGPKIAAVIKPKDSVESNRILFSAISGGADLQQMPQYYVSYFEKSIDAVRVSLPLENLMQYNKESRTVLTRYIEKNHLKSIKINYLPLRAKWHDQVVLIDGISGEVLGIVNMDPW